MNARTRTTFASGDEPLAVDHFLANHNFNAEGADDDTHSPGAQALPDLDCETELLDGLVGEDDEDVSNQLSKPRRGRPKGATAIAELPPIPEGQTVSVFERLSDYGLLRKITDIVLVKVGVPWHLRADATQEIHTAWAGLTVKPKFQRNQLANYAYLSGQHAALKLRRTIGAVVVIPGALFRTGRDTSFMGAIGAAINPRDVDDFKDSMELSVNVDEAGHLSRVSEAFFAERTASLNLTAKQRKVAFMTLVERKPADLVAHELNMQLVYVERLLNQVTNKLTSINASKMSGKGSKEKSATGTKASQPGTKKGTPAASEEPETPAVGRAASRRLAALRIEQPAELESETTLAA